MSEIAVYYADNIIDKNKTNAEKYIDVMELVLKIDHDTEVLKLREEIRVLREQRRGIIEDYFFEIDEIIDMMKVREMERIKDDAIIEAVSKIK